MTTALPRFPPPPQQQCPFVQRSMRKSASLIAALRIAIFNPRSKLTSICVIHSRRLYYLACPIVTALLCCSSTTTAFSARTDPQLTVEISCWRMLKQGDIALIHDLQRRRDLNRKTCRLVSYSDGRWACKLEEEDILLRIALKNLKPFSSTIDVCLEELAAVELV